MQSNTPATTTESTSIFLLNPLTVYFLSGFALQLFVFSCDHDHVASDKRSAKTTYESHIRMTRWLGVFKKHCAELFDLHSELYEKKAVEKSNSSHQLHSKLLIGATKKMLNAVANGHVKNEATLSKIKSWVELINSIKATTLWKIFEGEQYLDVLFERVTEQCNACVLQNSDNSNYSITYPHFSPQALFIRCAFIVFLHNQKYSNQTEYEMWESRTSYFLSNLLHVSEYLGPDKSELHHFLPSFPYIHHLPCSVFYKKWTDQDQLNHPVPVYDIFDLILQCLHGTMTTYDHMNVNTSCDEEESITEFYDVMNAAKGRMDQEKRRVISCEKQRDHQQNKRKHDSEKTPLYSLQTWLLKFLFPSKYYITVGINWGYDTWDCAN